MSKSSFTLPSSDSVLDNLVGIAAPAGGERAEEETGTPGPAAGSSPPAAPRRRATKSESRTAKPAAVRTPTSARASSGTELPMPPAKKKTEVRQTFATKLPPEMITRLRGWAFAHDVEIQDLVELALDEFLTQRGAPRASSQEVS